MTAEPKRWTSGEVTILLPEGGELKKLGSIHGDVAIAEFDGDWLVLHWRSGLILGRFASKGIAADLGHRLNVSVSQKLKHPPTAWVENFWKRLDEIRTEVARENGLPLPPPLRRLH